MAISMLAMRRRSSLAFFRRLNGRTDVASFFVVTLAIAFTALAVAAPSALAAPPEAPETLKPELETITATSATLRGILNPNKEGELGETYQFLYKASATECEGGSATPEPPASALGAEGELVSEPVSGLEEQTVYSVCLVAHNAANETTVGPRVTFLTGPPETPAGEEATEVTATSATLKGILNPNKEGEPGRYRFRYRASASECEGPGGKTSPDESEPAATSNGNQAEAVQAKVTGLTPGTTYTFCIFARTEAFETALGEPVSFTTPAAAPTISEEGSSAVGPGTAAVSAVISPGGLTTGYHVEYVTEAQFQASEWAGAVRVPASDTVLPAAVTPVAVREELTGLASSTTYRFRFVAGNTVGVIPGEAAQFTTAFGGTAATTLPDNRTYELVSSPESPGEVYVPRAGRVRSPEDTLVEFPFRASVDGDALTYVGGPGESAGGNGLTGQGLGNQFVSSRTPSQSRWAASNLTPQVAGVGEQASLTPYEAFSSDLSIGILDTPAAPSFAAKASPEGPAHCTAIYSRSGEGFHALFNETQTPGVCGVDRGQAERYSVQSLIFAGFTANDSQLLFQTPAPLTPGDEESEPGEGNNLYDSFAGQPTPVNVLPGGEREPDAVFGSTSGESFPPSGEPSQAHVPGNFGDIASADGSRIFWTALEPVEELGRPAAEHPKALYVREDPLSPSAKTVQLDVPQGGAPGPAGGGRFWAASSDGSKVFFADCSKLTADSTAVSSEDCSHTGEVGGGNPQVLVTGNDLYEYNFNKPAGSRLTDLSVDTHGSDPLGADVQGVLGSSADGSYVYFVAGGALAVGAEPRNCRQAAEEELEKESELNEEEKVQLRAEQKEEDRGHLPTGRGCNLYVIHAGEAPRLVAALGAKDDHLLRFEGAGAGGTGWLGGWRPSLGNRSAQVSPDGRHVVFESTQQLTGYDNSILGEADPQRALEVFSYAAEGAQLDCASCEPSAAAPVREEEAAGRISAGTYLPVSMNPTYMPRWMSEDGSRVFFDSSQPLVAQDRNGTQDVYEWEREGSGTCAAQTPARHTGGCVSLLSGGDSSIFSYFLDADVSGDNVFFTHRGQLGKKSEADRKNAVYDARVDGGFPQPAEGCSGTPCQGEAPAPPSLATSPAITFTGPGNLPQQPPAKQKAKTRAEIRAEKLAKALKSCRAKHNKRKRTACEKQARKRYGPVHKAKGKAKKSQSRRTHR